MRIYSINIENFRSFAKLYIEDFKDLNLIVGKNNIGKTSILESIFLSIGISNPNLAINIDGFRGLVHDQQDDFCYIFNNLDYNKTITIKTQLINPAQYRKLFIKPIFNSKKETYIKTSDLDTNFTENINKIEGIQFDFSVKSVERSKDNFKKAEVRFTSAGIKVTQPNDYDEKYRGVFLRPASSLQELYIKLDKILIKKGEEKFIKALQHIDKKIVGISLGSKNMIYFDIGIDQLVPIQIMGDGIIRYLSILSTIANAENGVVMIDEIENGFHYSILSNLWESIYDASKQYNVQVFASSHSFECTKAFSKILSTKLIKDDSIRLFRIEKNQDDYNTIKYDHELLQTSFENNWEIR